MSINSIIISAIASAVLFAVFQLMAKQKARFDQQSKERCKRLHFYGKIGLA